MAAIDQYIERIPNTELQEQIREEVARLTKKKRFGLVYENHLPDARGDDSSWNEGYFAW